MNNQRKLGLFIVVLVLLNAAPVTAFEYTDDNEGEQLIITAERGTLEGIVSDTIRFDVTNNSGKELADVEISFLFNNNTAQIYSVNKPTLVMEDKQIQEKKTCNTIVEGQSISIGGGQQKQTYICKDTEKDFNVAYDGSYFELKNVSVPVEKFPAVEVTEKDRFIIFNEEIFTGKDNVFTTSFLEGETKEFRIKVNYKWKSEGEFLIHAESLSDPKIYGILDPTWYDSEWNERREISIGTSHSAIDLNYTFNFVVDSSSWTALANLNDIRIVDQFDFTELDRNILGALGGDLNILFRANHDTIADSEDQNYYIYYNNPVAGSPPADLNKVYMFNDEFNDGIINTDVWTILSGTITETGGHALFNGGVDDRMIANDEFRLPINLEYETRTQIAGNTASIYMCGINDVTVETTVDYIMYRAVTGGANYFTANAHNSAVTNTSEDAVVVGSYRIQGFVWSSGNIGFIHDDPRVVEQVSVTNIPDNTDLLRSVFKTESDDLLVDWVRARHFLSDEIEVGIGVSEGKEGMTRFTFIDELSGAAVQPSVTIDGNNFDANVTAGGIMDLNVDTWVPQEYRVVASLTGYGTREWNFFFDPLSRFARKLTMLSTTGGQLINFRFYASDDTTLLANADINIYQGDLNRFVYSLNSDASGEQTYFLNPSDGNYMFKIQVGAVNHDRNMTILTINVPQDERNEVPLDANNFTLAVTGLGLSNHSDNAAIDINVFSDTLDFYNFLFDYNAQYFSRSYIYSVQGGDATATFQSYLVPTDVGTAATIRAIQSSDVTTPVPDLTIVISKELGGGKTEVQSVVTDAKGEAIINYIVGDVYVFDVYDSDLNFLFSESITATSTTIFIYLNEQTVSLTHIDSPFTYGTFDPQGGRIFKNPTILSQTVTISDDKTISRVEIFVTNLDVNVFDTNYTIGVANGFSNSINPLGWTGDLNFAYFMTMQVFLDDGTVSTFKTTYYFPVGSFDPFYTITQGVKLDLGCDATGNCEFLMMLSFFIIALILTGLRLEFGDSLGVGAMTGLTVMLMVVFTYIQWIPYIVTGVVVFIGALILVGIWKG